MDKLKLDTEKGKKRFEKKINKTKENELIFCNQQMRKQN